MRLLLSTTDTVLISFARSVLADYGIVDLMADQYTSAIEGSLPIIPRRILVAPNDWHAARRALTEAGLGHELELEADGEATGLSRSALSRSGLRGDPDGGRS